MYSVEADHAKRLFVITLSDHVTSEEVAAGSRELEALLEDAPPGFAVLADFRRVTTMKTETARHIGSVMDQFARKQVGLVVRVIPDRSKDIGLNILSRLHYRSGVELATVDTLAEAIALLLDGVSTTR